jgi:hypothetical protein
LLVLLLLLRLLLRLLVLLLLLLLLLLGLLLMLLLVELLLMLLLLLLSMAVVLVWRRGAELFSRISFNILRPFSNTMVLGTFKSWIASLISIAMLSLP